MIKIRILITGELIILPSAEDAISYSIQNASKSLKKITKTYAFRISRSAFPVYIKKQFY